MHTLFMCVLDTLHATGICVSRFIHSFAFMRLNLIKTAVFPELLGEVAPCGVWPTLQAFRHLTPYLLLRLLTLLHPSPDRSPELSVASWDDPSTLPQKEALCLFFAHSSATLLLLLSQKPLLSPHSHSSGLAPASHSHLQISVHVNGFIITRQKHSPNEQKTPRQRRAWVCGAQAPPPPPSCLLCRWISVKEPLSCFPGVNA